MDCDVPGECEKKTILSRKRCWKSSQSDFSTGTGTGTEPIRQGSGTALDAYLRNRMLHISRQNSQNYKTLPLCSTDSGTERISLSSTDQNMNHGMMVKTNDSAKDLARTPLSTIQHNIARTPLFTNFNSEGLNHHDCLPSVNSNALPQQKKFLENPNKAVIQKSTNEKRRGRGPSIKTILQRQQMPKIPYVIMENTSPKTDHTKVHVASNDPQTMFSNSKSCLTQQGTSRHGQYIEEQHFAASTVTKKIIGRKVITSSKFNPSGGKLSSCVLIKLNSSDTHHHKKYADVSPSEVKNLIDNFNEADDNQHDDEDMFDEYLEEEDFIEVDTWEGYMNLGPPTATCNQCGAVMGTMERNNKANKNSPSTFSLCCKNGHVVLPPEPQPPQLLKDLLSGSDRTSHFRQNIRVYNSMFAMCSSGGKIYHKINNGKGPYCFKLRGQNMHMLGSMLPDEGQTPKFCQLYIYDTENELPNRMKAMGSAKDLIDPTIVDELIEMFDEHNYLVGYFHTAQERFKFNELDEFKLVLISSEAANGRKILIGPSNEVAGLIVNPNADTSEIRDTIVETRLRSLKRVYETSVYFMQLQYPILFPHGTDGYHTKIPLKKVKKGNPESEEHADLDPERKHRDMVSMK